MKKVSFFDIFKTFLKIGAILLGGGYVIIPVMKDEIIRKRNWLTEDELMNFYCMSQCLPGIIAINMSILVGSKLLKFEGALAAILGMSVSPVISIIIVAFILNEIVKIPYLDGVFWGVNLAVIVLIYLTVKEMWSSCIVDKFSFFWFILILILALFKVNPVILILASCFIGLILWLFSKIKEKNNV